MSILSKIFCDRCHADLTNTTDYFKITTKKPGIIKDGKKTYPTIKTYDICSPCFEEFKKFIEEVKQ